MNDINYSKNGTMAYLASWILPLTTKVIESYVAMEGQKKLSDSMGVCEQKGVLLFGSSDNRFGGKRSVIVYRVCYNC